MPGNPLHQMQAWLACISGESSNRDSKLTDTSLLLNSRTKTVATVGPACATEEKLTELIKCGVDVFRLNMAHGSRADHELALKNIQSARNKLGWPVAVLVDLAGPKIRLGQLFGEPVNFENGEQVRFVRGTMSTAREELTCLYEPLIDEVSVGDAIVLADGLVRLQATEKSSDQLKCVVVDGGKIRSRQGVNLPGTHLSVPALGEVDIENAIWAANHEIDFVSLSFVRNADEVRQLQKILADHGSSAYVVAKIEKKEALNQLDSIIKAADAIMVARGDLGVEIDIEKTPAAQKRIIKTCLQHRKPVIVATQMLESMHSSKQPTRAEVTDVANAILDGADACMLSGETAIGEYPEQSVRMMNKIMWETEKAFAERNSRMTAYDRADQWKISDAVIFGSAEIARRISARMVVIASRKNRAAKLKSKQRDFIPTVCITDDPKELRQMCLFWGVLPVLCPGAINDAGLELFINEWAKQNTDVEVDDPYVLVTDTELLPGIYDSVLVSKIK